MTSRELVTRTLEFRNSTGRVPRDLWLLPWAEQNYGAELKAILRDFPPDIVQVPESVKSYAKQPAWQGNAYEPGTYKDEWGVIWKIAARGHLGEVKDPIVGADDENWADLSRVHFPEELLTIDTDRIDAFCEATEQFVVASDLARPFERMHFIRGAENYFIDLALENEGMLAMLARVHDFNCRLLEVWAGTKVDALFAMDDWGTQRSLLINPDLWRKVFKPLYKDYVDIARRNGKKIFFHSDGYTLDIVEDLTGIGFDAVNLQIFAIGIGRLARFKGRITFWGELDRQHLLPKGSREDIETAVRSVYETLWDTGRGGAIAQCEFGPGANPANIISMFETWDMLGEKN